MHIGTLAIIGVGLIGGSIGLAVKHRGLAKHVVGVARREETIRLAVERGAIDRGTLELRAGVAEADLVVVCTPVNSIAPVVLEVGNYVKPGTVITDAGSTKSRIVDAVHGKLRPQVEFIGSHPIAGSEKTGVEHASADLFDGRVAVVTPTADANAEAVERVGRLWQGLGMQVRYRSPEEHDQALALTSHLPHLVAAALAGVLPPELSDFVGTGFLDTTRVAAGDPALWTPILQTNRDAVLAALDRLEAQLADFRKALKRDDDIVLEVLLTEGKKVRDALGNRTPSEGG